MYQLPGNEIYLFSLASGGVVAGGLVAGMYIVPTLRGMPIREQVILGALGLTLGSLGGAAAIYGVQWNAKQPQKP